MSVYSNTAKRFDAAFSRQTFHKSIQHIQSNKKTSDQIRGFLKSKHSIYYAFYIDLIAKRA